MMVFPPASFKPLMGTVVAKGRGSEQGWSSRGKRVLSCRLNVVGLFGALLPFCDKKSGCG